MKTSLRFSVIMLLALPVMAQDTPTPTTPAWTARTVPKDLIDSVINGNLFVPNQRREPRVEPPPGNTEQETTSAPEPQRTEIVPDDPDRDYRLIGTSQNGGQWLAFIENNQSQQIHRIAVDQPIASGRITHIDFNRIEYAVNDETRGIQIGRDLTGAAPIPTLESDLDNLFAPSTNTEQAINPSGADQASDTHTTGPVTDTAGESSRAEILRRLRERRERESQ